MRLCETHVAKNPLCDPAARQPFPATRAFVLDVSPSWTVRHPPHHLPRRAPRDATPEPHRPRLSRSPPRGSSRASASASASSYPSPVVPSRLPPPSRRDAFSYIHARCSRRVRRYDDVTSTSRLSPPSRRRRPRPEGIFPTSHARFDDDDDDDASSSRSGTTRAVSLAVSPRRARAARDEEISSAGAPRRRQPPRASSRLSLSRARRPNADDVDDDDDDVVENAVARRARDARRRGARERVDVTSNASRQTTPRALARLARERRSSERNAEELERDGARLSRVANGRGRVGIRVRVGIHSRCRRRRAVPATASDARASSVSSDGRWTRVDVRASVSDVGVARVLFRGGGGTRLAKTRGGDASDGDDERVAIARDERGAARADGASMRDGSRASTRERDGERDASEKEPAATATAGNRA